MSDEKDKEPVLKVKIDPEAAPGNVVDPLARLLLAMAKRALAEGDKKVTEWANKLLKGEDGRGPPA